MKHIVILGDSHISALKRGSDIMDVPANVQLHFIPFGRGTFVPSRFWAASKDGTQLRLTVEAWNKVVFPIQLPQISDGDEIVYVLSLPCNTSRFLRDYDWSRFVPWQAKTREEEIPLSDAVMGQLIEGDSGQALTFAAHLHSLGTPVVAVQGPRYFAHSDTVTAMKPGLAGTLTEHFMEHVKDRLAKDGIRLIQQPASTVGEDGQTLDAYRHERANDQHHGSAEFGRLMCLEILQNVA